MFKLFSILTGFLFIFSFRSALAQTPLVSTHQASDLDFKQVDSNGLYKTASGAIFPIPEGWFVKSQKGFFVLQDPNRQLTMIIAESEEPNGLDAINDSWKNYDPNFSLITGRVNNYPGRDKWEKIITPWYYAPDPANFMKPDVNRQVWAVARKKGDYWYVVLFDGNSAAADRRSAQVNLIISGLEPPGSVNKPVLKTTGKFDPSKLKTFEDFIRQAMDKCRIPGAAIAVVQDGKVMEEKGFGVREKGKSEPVTPQTLFSIGSITKPLTTLLMARLVDAGKFTWDTPVTLLDLSFRTADTQMTTSLSLKYTVCACAGLPRQDTEMIFEADGTTPEMVIDKMRTMAPTTGFGETFQYSNIMVAAGGYIAAHAVSPEKSMGQSYDDAMQTYVFDPLGMKNTTLDFQSIGQKEYATPHSFDLNWDYQTIPLSDDDWTRAYRPAAGVWSNVDDMAKYLLLELSDGMGPDGTRIISYENLHERRQPKARMSDTETYGLGLIVKREDGILIVGHNGNTTGYTSALNFYPDSGTGLVLLTNADQANLFTRVVKEKFAELLFGKDTHAQNDLDLYSPGQKSNQEYIDRMNRQSGESWVYNFRGDYINQILGRVSLFMADDGPTLDMGKWKLSINAFSNENNGELKFYVTSPPFIWTVFTLDDQDGKKTITYETPQQKYIFEQVSGSQGR